MYGGYFFMGIGELLLLAVGVSMDAFAVSICKGLAMKKATLKASMTFTTVTFEEVEFVLCPLLPGIPHRAGSCCPRVLVSRTV